ncbi:9295_t:CDS:2, partial [Gigaspora rosea]
MNTYIGEPDFNAGYYQALTYVAIVIVISIVYQTKQIQRYLSGSKVPDIPDLPQRKDKYEQNVYAQGMSQSTTALAPTSKIHFTPTVYAHKIWNYVFHILGVGDMSIGEIIIFILYVTINIIFLVIPFNGSGIPSMINIRAAYVALGNAAFVYPMATRNSVFLKLIGVPFERMIRFHRWVGRTIFYLLTFHASYQITIVGNISQIFSREVTRYAIRFINGFKPVGMVSIEALSGGVTRIVFDFKSRYEAGQYMFVNFSNLNPPVSLIAWHPVSFSSAPGIGADDVSHDSIHMKIQGSFTRRLYAQSQEGIYNMPSKMKVDGPYGRPTLDFSSYRTVVLVAGGIGITPMISILKDLVDRQISNKPIVTQSIYFLWTIPDTNSYSWFGNELTETNDKFTKRLPENKYLLDIKIFLTKSTTTPSSLFFQGRPDFLTVMQDLKQYHGSGDIAVGVCGPTSMLKEVRKAAVAESDETCLIKVHRETF